MQALCWGINVLKAHPGMKLCMDSANKTRRYMITLAVIGWADAQNDPCHVNSRRAIIPLILSGVHCIWVEMACIHGRTELYQDILRDYININFT